MAHSPKKVQAGKKTLPRLTCTKCRRTKSATRFPRRSSPTAKALSYYNPNKYRTTCKLCNKPVPANAGADYKHKEPREISRIAGGKASRWPHIREMKERKKRATLKRVAMSKAEKRVETRIKSMQYLADKGCEECDERDPRKLEYDHRNPDDKHKAIARLIMDGYSWTAPVLRKEITKCRILCASCHRVSTIKQQGYYPSPVVKSTLRALARKHGFRV